jgi:putative membrane protein
MAVAGPVADDTGAFRVHVVQHLLLATAAPLALALASPVLLALRTLPVRPRRLLLAVVSSRVARWATSPGVVLVAAAGGTSAYYLTPLYPYAEQRAWLHALVHAHMLVAGCLLAWCVVAPAPSPVRPLPLRLATLALAAGSHDAMAKLMYVHQLPAEPGVRTGAQLLWYGGDALEVLTAVLVLSAWYAAGGRRLRHTAGRAPVTALSTACPSASVDIG